MGCWIYSWGYSGNRRIWTWVLLDDPDKLPIPHGQKNIFLFHAWKKKNPTKLKSKSREKESLERLFEKKFEFPLKLPQILFIFK